MSLWLNSRTRPNVVVRNMPWLFLCLQCDMPKDGVVADAAKMDEFCKEQGFIGWFETSAKENIGIDEAAQFLVSKVREWLA